MKDWGLIEGSEVVVRKENFRVQDFKNGATPVEQGLVVAMGAAVKVKFRCRLLEQEVSGSVRLKP